MIARTVEDATAELASRGYISIDGIDGIAVGVRVRNYGERYPEARDHGTAVVRAVMERDPSSWSHSYGRRDVEVVVERDRPGLVGEIGVWADYGTRVVTR